MPSRRVDAFGEAILEVVSHYPQKNPRGTNSLVHNYSSLSRQYMDFGKVKLSRHVPTYATDEELSEFYGEFFPGLKRDKIDDSVVNDVVSSAASEVMSSTILHEKDATTTPDTMKTVEPAAPLPTFTPTNTQSGSELTETFATVPSNFQEKNDGGIISDSVSSTVASSSESYQDNIQAVSHPEPVAEVPTTTSSNFLDSLAQSVEGTAAVTGSGGFSNHLDSLGGSSTSALSGSGMGSFLDSLGTVEPVDLSGTTMGPVSKSFVSSIAGSITHDLLPLIQTRQFMSLQAQVLQQQKHPSNQI